MPTVEQLAAAYQVTFAPGSPGELVLEDLAKMSGLLGYCYIPGDAHGSTHNEGRRSLMVDILNRLSWTMSDMVQFRMRLAAERQREIDAAMEEEF